LEMAAWNRQRLVKIRDGARSERRIGASATRRRVRRRLAGNGRLPAGDAGRGRPPLSPVGIGYTPRARSVRGGSDIACSTRVRRLRWRSTPGARRSVVRARWRPSFRAQIGVMASAAVALSHAPLVGQPWGHFDGSGRCRRDTGNYLRPF
jgi:hypothetical protein